MKTTYLQNRDVKEKRKAWIFIFIIFVALSVSNKHLRQAISRSATLAFTPFLKISRLTNERWNNFTFIFKNKNQLGEEVKKLTLEKVELEKEILMFDYLRAENEELKSLLERTNNKELVLASIISRPPQSPYDMIIVDAGAINGIESGMKAIAYSNIIIGHVTEVFPESSKVTLISSSGEETNVFIESVRSGNAKVAAVSVGLGGGNMEIKIPSSIQVSSGDQIITTGTFPFLAGTAEKIEMNLSDPFQRVLFRLPVNLQQAKHITIEK